MLDPGIIELEVKDKWPESLCTVTIFFSGKYDLIQLHRQIIHQNDGIIHEKLIEITTILCMIFARIGHGPCYYYWNEIFAGVYEVLRKENRIGFFRIVRNYLKFLSKTKNIRTMFH